MLTPPTDSLYKFIAILGLLIISSCITFWWNASKELEQFIHTNIDYVNDVYCNAGETYGKFAQKTNEIVAIFNSVHGNADLLTKEQFDQLEKLFPEAERLQKASHDVIQPDSPQILSLKLIVAKYNSTKTISMLGILAGTFTSILGFYLWYTRVQKYLDKSHAANRIQ